MRCNYPNSICTSGNCARFDASMRRSVYIYIYIYIYTHFVVVCDLCERVNNINIQIQVFYSVRDCVSASVAGTGSYCLRYARFWLHFTDLVYM